MRKILFGILFMAVGAPLWGQSEMTTASFAFHDPTTTTVTWDGGVYIDRNGSDKLRFKDGSVDSPVSGLSAFLTTGSGTTTFVYLTGTSLTLTGQLGVGLTTAPEEIVQVYGNTVDDVTVLIENDGTSTWTQAAVSVRAGTAWGSLSAVAPSYAVAEKPGLANHIVLHMTTPTQGLVFVSPNDNGTIEMRAGAWSSTATQCTVTSAGLGIGTAAPTRRLHVEGTTANTGSAWIERSQVGTEGANLYLVLDRAGAIGQAGDEIGYLHFRSRDTSATMFDYCGVRGEIDVPTSGSVDGKLVLWVREDSDTATDMVEITTTGTHINGAITSDSGLGSGDVVGPGSSTDNAVARFNSTTGKLLQNSVVTIGDSGNVNGVSTLSMSGKYEGGYQRTAVGGASFTFDPANGNVQLVDLSEAITIGDPTLNLDIGQVYTLILQQPSGAFWGVTWDAAFEAPGGGAMPTMTATNDACDIYQFILRATPSELKGWRVAADIR